MFGRAAMEHELDKISERNSRRGSVLQRMKEQEVVNSVAERRDRKIFQGRGMRFRLRAQLISISCSRRFCQVLVDEHEDFPRFEALLGSDFAL